MTESKEARGFLPSRSAAIWLSVLPLFMGGFITGIGLLWIPCDPAKIHAPYWVIVVAGLMFMSAGLAVLSATWTRYRRLQTLFGFGILLGLPLIFNWVAFGEGERHFTSTTSFSATRNASGPVDEREGRVVFGIGAVILDIVLGAMLVELWRERSD